MTLRVPDPFQLFDHTGQPEDGGPLRFIERQECACGRGFIPKGAYSTLCPTCRSRQASERHRRRKAAKKRGAAKG